jgi:hypothetical protein
MPDSKSELKITDYPMFVLLHCDVNANDWHVIRGFDPDQESLAIENCRGLSYATTGWISGGDRGDS